MTVEAFCHYHGIPCLPAQPGTLSGYIAACADLTPDLVFSELQRCDEQHAALGYSEPAKSSYVTEAFSKVFKVKAPRSWPAAEQRAFMLLPYNIQMIVLRREAERDRALSQCQNDAAQWRKLKEKSNVDEKAKVA